VVLLFWDASALAKRYSLEIGSDAVDALFAQISSDRMVATFLGYAETYSTLLRRQNRGDITAATFQSAVSLLQAEILDKDEFGLLTVSDAAILAGIEYMTRHNLNSSDAAILTTFLRYAQAEAAIGATCVLVAADQRLLQAAQAEALNILNPELLHAAAIASYLAGLATT
jgi:predicted nucleic acid-binding protein